MLTKKKIVSYLSKYDHEYDIKQQARYHMHDWTKSRNSRLMTLVVILIIAAAIVVDIFLIRNTVAETAKYSPDVYLTSADTNRIIDPNNFLTGEKRNALLEEINKTNGSIYKIVFVADDGKNMGKTFKDISATAINNVLYEAPNGLGDAYRADTIVILYNTKTDEYALYPTRKIIENTHIFDLVDTSSMSNSNAERQFNVPDSIVLNTTKAYSEILTGTPAEVYAKVFEYAQTHGYSDEELTVHLADFVTDRKNNDDVGTGFITVIISVGVVFISFLIILPIIDHRGAPWWATMIYEKAIAEAIAIQNAKDEEEEKKRLEEEEKRQKEFDRETRERNYAEQEEMRKKHPLKEIIDLLSQIQSSNEFINIRRAELMKVFEVAESILVNQIKEGHPQVARFKTYYLGAFKDNLEDIVFHSQKHATKFDTPEEVPLILKTFDVYERITNKFIDKSEQEGTDGIGDNLKVMEQMAAMDGLADSEMQAAFENSQKEK